MIVRVVKPAFAQANGRLPRQVIVFPVMGEHFRVIVCRQVRIPQTEITREIADRKSLALVLWQYRMGIRIIRQTDCPVDSDLAIGFTCLNSLINTFDRPTSVFFHPTAIEPELHQRNILLCYVDQLIQLFNHIGIINTVFRPVFHISIDFTIPQRIIKSQSNVILFTSFGNRLDYIGRIAR